MLTCPACGMENPEGFRFCGFCPAPLLREGPAAGEERTVGDRPAAGCSPR